MTYLKVSRKNKYLLQLAQNAIFDVKMTQINDWESFAFKKKRLFILKNRCGGIKAKVTIDKFIFSDCWKEYISARLDVLEYIK